MENIDLLEATFWPRLSAGISHLWAAASSPAVARLNRRDGVTIPGYTYEGCYTEATDMRALSALAYYNDQMTVEDCAAACSSYTWFGVEYGRECYCGDAVNPGSVPAPESSCDFECPGNSSETCGAGNRLNMYCSSATAPVPLSAITTYSSLGCYTEATNERALSSASIADDEMTVSVCGTFCVGYDYFGVEYGRECYCGNVLNFGSAIATPSSCDMACSGDTTELCGGPLRLDVYEYVSLVSPTSLTASSSTTSFQQSSSSSSSSPAASSSTSSLPQSSSLPSAVPTSTSSSSVSASASGTSSSSTSSLLPSSSSLSVSSSSSYLQPSSTSTLPPTILTTAPICNHDNCLNELNDARFSASASAFCQTYTTTVNANPDAIPTYLENCQLSPSAVSSACTCILYTPPVTSSTTASPTYSSTSSASSTTSSATSSTLSSLSSSSSSSSLLSTSSSSRSSSSSSILPTPTVPPVVLYAQPDDTSKPSRKRQTYNAAVLLGDGRLSADCQSADKFYIQGGKLYDNDLIVGSDEGAPYALLTGSSNPGSIQGTFSVVENLLVWSNSSFSTAKASFCVLDDLVIALFVASAPANCVPVQIAVGSYPVICPGSGISTSTTFQPITAALTANSTAATSASTTALPSCSVSSDPSTDVNVVPAVDPNIDQSSLLNLAPSDYATLYYAQPPPGTTVLEVEYAMAYPQVTLENSNALDTVICDGDSITLTVSSPVALEIISQWPETNLVLITNSAGCNPVDQRGVYLVTSYFADSGASIVTLEVTTQTWIDVAVTMEVSFGTAVTGTSASVSYTPSCIAAYPTASSSTGTITYASLTPEEKLVVAFLTGNTTYNANGNIVGIVPNQTQQAVPTPTFNLNPSASQQAAAEAALEAAGLPPPNSMYNTTSANLGGYCSNGVYVPPTTKRSVLTQVRPAQSRSARTSPSRPSTHKRDEDLDDESWWEFVWDIGCDDALVEAIDDADEEVGVYFKFICDLKGLFDSVEAAYESRNAIKCVITNCVAGEPPATQYDYTYAWEASVNVPTQILVDDGPSSISCVDCSLTVSNVQFKGRVTIVLSTGKREVAFMIPVVSWSANLVMGLSSTGADSGTWDYTFDEVDFPSPVTVPNEFTITPSLIYSLGVSWSTDSAVDFQGGGYISVNSGSLELDFIAQSVSSVSGWQPAVSLVYPVFTTASTVYWNPIMRQALSISVNIMNAPYGEQPLHITSATSLGFNAALIESDGGACTAGELMMTSYSNIANNINWNGQNQQALNSAGNTAGQTKCFNVPNDYPTVDEVNFLRSVGGDFCTSYLSYTAPTSIAYEATTAIVPSPIFTTIPTTISTTSTLHLSPTISITIGETTTVAPTHYIYVAGTQALGDQYLKKRSLEIPVATTLGTATRSKAPKITSLPAHVQHGHGVAKRQVAKPTFISTWDTSKISLACSQIATGISTSTFYSSTATSYSGSTTETVYSTIDVKGQIKTVILTQSVILYTATTFTNTALATKTITSASSCPLQTQVSCFTITGHGAPQIENTNLYMPTSQYETNPTFLNWPGYQLDPFYLSCEGYLVSLPGMLTLVENSLAGSDGYISFQSFDYASEINKIQSCTQDTVAKTLTCGSLWSVSTVSSILEEDDYIQEAFLPAWDDETDLGPLIPITLSYDEVACPCQY